MGLKYLIREPSFFPHDFCWRNFPARLVTFSLSCLCCYLPSEDRNCQWQQRVQNFGLFFYFSSFFCNFSSFLWWNFFKLCPLSNCTNFQKNSLVHFCAFLRMWHLFPDYEWISRQISNHLQRGHKTIGSHLKWTPLFRRCFSCSSCQVLLIKTLLVTQGTVNCTLGTLSTVHLK